MTKRRAEADVERFKALVEDASVEEVETPTGRKEVEVAWEDDDGFHSKEGLAIGVYHEPNRINSTIVHIDWEDGGRTSVTRDEIVTLEESEYI